MQAQILWDMTRWQMVNIYTDISEEITVITKGTAKPSICWQQASPKLRQVFETDRGSYRRRSENLAPTPY
jgi:hypothetical protein